MTSLTITKRFVLHALHNLNNPQWSNEKNTAMFGKCFRLHGHDFKFDISIKGSPDPTTGFAYPPEKLEEIINKYILGPYCGKNLNEYFSNPSGEGLVVEFYKILKEPLGDSIANLSLQETLKNSFSYPI
ncbi:MAG: 6-carboxytetrahydropterin synthase [Pseudomonadota bacterium]|nr:6-carboxytetrahydropterin synthase [Pseudomonadota bacterium]